MFKGLGFVFFGAIVSTVSFAGQYRCIYTGSPDGVRFGYRWTCNQSAPTQSEAERSCFRALIQNNLIVSLVGCSQTGAQTETADVGLNTIGE